MMMIISVVAISIIVISFQMPVRVHCFSGSVKHPENILLLAGKLAAAGQNHSKTLRGFWGFIFELVATVAEELPGRLNPAPILR